MLLSCLGNSTQAGVRSPPVSFKSAWLLKLIFWRTFVACNCSGASARDQFRYLRKIHFRVQLWVDISVFFSGSSSGVPFLGQMWSQKYWILGSNFWDRKWTYFWSRKRSHFRGQNIFLIGGWIPGSIFGAKNGPRFGTQKWTRNRFRVGKFGTQKWAPIWQASS